MVFLEALKRELVNIIGLPFTTKFVRLESPDFYVDTEC